jgi:outer membrane protein assembly factor BamB
MQGYGRIRRSRRGLQFARNVFPVLVIVALVLGSVLYFSYFAAQSRTTSSMRSTSTLYSVGSWPTYHKDGSRSGLESTGPRFTSANQAWSSQPLDGKVYAEPLLLRGLIIVGSENNSVYGFRISDGSEVWRTHLGDPMPLRLLPCGNIDPSGITGTPVADTVSGTIYVVAFTGSLHKLFAINSSTGIPLWYRTIDPPGSNPLVEQQRAALALSNGIVYIAFGGLFGDCGDYHGWIVGAPTNGSGKLVSFQVPTGRGGGIWAPSGPGIDPRGNIVVATGNSESLSTFDFGDSVILLSPKLLILDWFAPPNWSELNGGDTDLGSVGPAILDSNTLFQVGKEGIGYLVALDHMGKVGGALFSAKVCDGAYGGTAYSPPLLFVPCTGGIVALRVSLSSNASFSVLWQSSNFRAGPPIVSRGAVWAFDLGSGTIYALDPQTGSALFSTQVGRLAQFSSPSAGSGYVVAVTDRVILFALT